MIIAIVVTLIVGFFFVGGAGYLVHRSLHKPIMGPFYRSHHEHHVKKYPPEDYLSKTYRSSSLGRRSVFYYAVPAGLTAVAFFYFLPVYIALTITLELVVIAYANDWLHARLHIDGHWLEKFEWFRVLRAKHWYHHLEEGMNFGIFDFNADRVFGTYEGSFPPPAYVEDPKVVKVPQMLALLDVPLHLDTPLLTVPQAEDLALVRDLTEPVDFTIGAQ